MKITEVRVKLLENKGRLKASASITLDSCFCVKDVKIIDDETKGGLFVSMPCYRCQDACPQCNFKNPVTDNYCGNCGIVLQPHRAKVENGRPQLFFDVAHPVTQEFREYLETEVLDAYDRQMDLLEGKAVVT